MQEEPQIPPVEVIPEPEEIIAVRKIIARMTEMVDAGEVESVSCYVEQRDGTYRTMQSACPGRLEDAGKILELAILRLGFVDRVDVQAMINDAIHGGE